MVTHREYLRVCAERDALKKEVEELKAQLAPEVEEQVEEKPEDDQL